LLEGLVFAERIADNIGADLSADARCPRRDHVVVPAGVLDPSVRGEIQRVMTAYAGVLRNDTGLAVAERELAELASRTTGEPCVDAWEATNLHAVATAIVAAARRREETRGSHWREDFPERDDAGWRGHLVTRLEEDLTITYEEMR
jgi:L-aspartate oxidase